MVAPTIIQNGDAAGDAHATNDILQPVPKGKYTLVGVDIDTTGRRLIDEIVQLAAYSPKDHFEQYIMPYMNLNPAARQRHQVRVISIGFYRMLKSMQTYKIIKSKSEIAALKDFLDWLEALKAKDVNTLGIILVYHEERKFIPYMILESLKKYNLLDRFLATVKSFTNGYFLAKANANESLQHCTLRKLAKVLNAQKSDNNNNINGTTDVENIKNGSGGASCGGGASGKTSQHQTNDRELFDGNASVRAKLAFEVALLLSNQGSKQSIDTSEAFDKMLSTLQPYAKPIQCDLNELQTQNEILERQNSFRPVFIHYFKSTLYHRVRAVKFRIILAEQGYDLQSLNALWTEKQKNGLIEALKVIEELKTDDKTELADLFDSYYDPSKTTIKPIVKNNNNNRRRNRRGIRGTNTKNENGNNGNATRSGSEHGAGGDKEGATTVQVPDSTTKTTNGNNSNNNNNANNSNLSRGRPNRNRRNNVRSRNNSLRSKKPIVAQTPNGTANSSTASVPIVAAN